MFFRKSALIIPLAVLLVTKSSAQGTFEDYQRADQFITQNAEKLMANLRVAPHWIDESSSFWYRNRLIDNHKEFILVDSEKGVRERAFDHERLAIALSKQGVKSYRATKLPFDFFEYSSDDAIEFQFGKSRWRCDLKDYSLEKIEEKEKPSGLSPDSSWVAFYRDYNLWLRSTDSGEEWPLTTDGAEKHDYGYWPSWYELENLSKPAEPSVPEVSISWSPDSKKILAFRLDRRNAQKLFLMKYAPEDDLRAQAFAYERALPGDTLLTMVEYMVFDAESRGRVNLQLEKWPSFLASGGPFWLENSRRLHFRRFHRGYNFVELLEIDATTGGVRKILEERQKTFVDLYLLDSRFLKEREKILWTSERSGWNHIYLFDAKTGAMNKQVTQGDFMVHALQRVDEKRREIWFTAGGREKERDPYFSHLYKVGFDGKGLKLLTPEDADHSVSFSPNGEFFVDVFSRVDLAPKSVLRRSKDGKIVRVLEEANIEKLLATGWRHPEAFKVKGRDGETDIYGAIFRPANFDSTKKYPVIDATYTGPHTFRTPKSFFGAYRDHAQALAQIGFIVVTVDGLGTSRRSKAFHDFSHQNLGDAGSADHILAIKKMARKYAWMDTTRVGIFGHSAGGYEAAHALLVHPEFYKVAISSAGNHDHRMAKVWWPEKFMGLLGEHYEQQSNLTLAKNLQGKLLLATGDMDNNVNPAATIRLADALIKSNKDFDLLMIPNKSHRLSDHPYFLRKRWDYFVEHLLGVTPPKEFVITAFDEAGNE